MRTAKGVQSDRQLAITTTVQKPLIMAQLRRTWNPGCYSSLTAKEPPTRMSVTLFDYKQVAKVEVFNN